MVYQHTKCQRQIERCWQVSEHEESDYRAYWSVGAVLAKVVFYKDYFRSASATKYRPAPPLHRFSTDITFTHLVDGDREDEYRTHDECLEVAVHPQQIHTVREQGNEKSAKNDIS